MAFTSAIPTQIFRPYNGPKSILHNPQFSLQRHPIPSNPIPISSHVKFSLKTNAASFRFSPAITPRRPVHVRVTGSEGNTVSFKFPTVVEILHLAVSLGIVLAADKFLKRAFVAAAIKFPSALFGMFCVFSVLVVLDFVAPRAAKSLMDFFEPATGFIQRWLPLFYVPSLVVLPLAVKDIPAASGIKICVILVGGWVASLFVAGYTAISIRRIVKTEMIDAEPMAKPSPFAKIELWAWSAVFVPAFILAIVNPTALGTSVSTCLPFLLSATVLGYMVGTGLPAKVKNVFHPILCCAISADLAAIAYG